MAKRILVIDDDQGVRDAFTLTLEDAGFAVEAAESGEKGLQMKKDNKYDLIFLDLKMPGIDGVQALREMRKADKETSVYIVTAFHKEFFDQLQAAEQEGMDFDIIEKPIDGDEIISITKGVLGETTEY